MKRYGLALKSFAQILEINPASFSLALREPRHWFDANLIQKKCYYILYLWLNLPQKFREGTLRPFNEALDVEALSPVASLPKLSGLIAIFAQEVAKNKISLVKFGQKILQNLDSLTLRNLLVTPLPWELMSWNVKVLINELIHW